MECKGYCNYCKTKNDFEKVFLIDTNDKYCYCPNCDKKILTKDAKDAFNHKIRGLLRRATFTLNIKSSYLDAYQKFGYVLNFDEGNCLAICGRMESLLMCSTLRDVRFDDVKILLDIALKTSLKKVKNYHCFYNFYIKTTNILDKYMLAIKKNLTIKNYFYDLDCLKLYYTRGIEILDIYKMILKGFLNFKEHELLQEKVNQVVDNFEKFIEQKINILQQPYSTVDGLTYTLGKKFSINDLNLKCDGIKVNTKLGKYKKYTLDGANNTKVIKDKVFASNKLRYTYFILSLVGVFSFIIVGLTSFILSFIFNEYFPLLLSIGIVLILLGLGCIAIRLLIKKQIKKRVLKNFNTY